MTCVVGICGLQFGDKLSSPLIQDWLQHLDIQPLVVYFTCTGQSQLQRMQQRGEPRDDDKYGQFYELRERMLLQHESELQHVPHIRLDTEDPIAVNVGKLLQVLSQPIAAQAGLPAPIIRD